MSGVPKRDAPNRLENDNPFSSRFVRPGAIRYVFEASVDARSLVERFGSLGGRAQIVGPHGSGKSTLVAELVAEFEAAGRHVLLVALRDGERRMPADWIRAAARQSASIVVVDGFEQLSAWSRFWLKRRCNQRALGLLVTAHEDVGLPTLATTRPSLALAHAIVERLVQGRGTPTSAAEVEACFHRAGGNLRETLFALYDVYEQRAEGSSPPAAAARSDR